MGNTDARHENASKLDLNHKITSEEESVMKHQQMKVAAADFSPHACLTCTLRWDLSSFSAHSKWKREEHLLPGESTLQKCSIFFFFVGGGILFASRLILRFALREQRSDRLGCCVFCSEPSAAAFSQGLLSLSRREAHPSSDPRAWLTATVFHRLRSKQCFTSLQLSLVA